MVLFVSPLNIELLISITHNLQVPVVNNLLTVHGS